MSLQNSWICAEPGRCAIISTGMRNYSGVKVMQIIEKLKEVDAKSKGIDNPFTSAGELMRELIFFILH